MVGGEESALRSMEKLGPRYALCIRVVEREYADVKERLMRLCPEGVQEEANPSALSPVPDNLLASFAHFAPAFHTSPQHYAEQKMRLLEPIFQTNGVDVVFAGHVHNYQRSKPLRFTPNPAVRDARGRVNGDFVFDDEFDGVTKTTPKGVIHIVTGGGGATLYNAKEFDKTVAQLAKDNPGNYVPLTAKYVADKHSLDPDSDHVSETSDEETETHCDGDSLTGCLNGDHEDVGTIFFFWDI